MAILEWLEITGFRSFAGMQRLDFSGDLALIWGANSQGKTSIAEAIEFLLTGGTIRRELLGGAKAEFGACLRNAHLPGDAPVVVRAGIREQAGELREVERTLTRDYGADADCDSALAIDGVPATDVSSLGIVLADPPLRAPVLLQHSLRFALSARPQDRSNYFKSVLEIQDLEVLRDLIEGSAGSLQTAAAPLVAKLRGLRMSKRLGRVANDVEVAELGVVPSKLSDAIDAALIEVGITPQGNEGLPSRVASLVAALERQREASFPSSAYEVANEVPGPLDAVGLVAARAFNEAIAAVDQETDRVTRIFEAVLAVPTIVETSTAVDCPVCESAGALTPERIAGIREQVAATVGFRQAEAAARDELVLLVRQLDAVTKSARALAPGVAGLGSDALLDHETIVDELLGNPDLHRVLLPLASELANAATALAEASGRAAGTARAGVGSIGAAKVIDVGAIVGSVEPLESLQGKLETAYAAYAGSAAELLGFIKLAIDRKQGTDDLRVLAELAADANALRSELLELRGRTEVRRELEKALKEVDKAKAKVFDEKFDDMSAEIEIWWQLLRPDESVRFASVRRRGSGRRFVMFKAHLYGAPGLAAIERDALGVFSDSQLNALGLAAFLARARLQKTPLIVLDDPLQAGDEEHRATFVGYVINKLLELGVQVIVLTYDDMTSKLIHHRYESVPVVGFSVSLDRPADGSVVIRSTNTAEALLQRGKVYLESDDPEFRSSAAGHLRKAGERIAKEIIVNARTAKFQPCSLADYEDVTLGPLITELTPYLTKPDHAGKWKVVGDLLNPGSHDDAPPTKQDLKMAFGYLREALRDYLRAPAPVPVPTT